MADQLFIIFFITIIAVRLFLWLAPTPSPTLGRFRFHHHLYHKFRTHHWMFGLVAMVIALLVRWPTLWAVGLGLFVDELTYILIGGKTHQDNYSIVSIAGTCVLIIVVYILRKNLFFSL